MRDEQQRLTRQISYIHCWFAGHAESRKMWYDFGGKGTGVCIQTTSLLLKEAVLSNWPDDLIFQMHKCQYTGPDVQLPEFLPRIPSIRKDTHFADQQEIRILAEIDVTKVETLLPGPDHKMVPVDLAILMQRVITGPSMTADQEYQIQDTVKQLGLKIDVSRSCIL